VKRLFWLSVGAAAGYYAARKSSEAVEQARERGLMGNVTLAASTATKVAGSATKAVSSVGSKTRVPAEPSPAPGTSPSPTSSSTPASTSSPSTRSREVRP